MRSKAKWAFLLILLTAASGCQKEEIIPANAIDEDPTALAGFREDHDAGTPTSAAERAALADFYNSLESTGTLAWPVDDPESDPCVDCWEGVTCEEGRIVRVHLYNHGLSGLISRSLGNLANLEWLHLGMNDLSGAVPEELGRLVNLEHLELSGNQLTGNIPVALGSLAHLDWLEMGSNNLNGPIPPELENLGDLTHLYLGGNDLAGPIPAELGNLEKLQSIRLGDNQLSGPIPTQLGDLNDLIYLDFGKNNLTGPIPIELGKLEKLEDLVLDHNQLQGAIPAELGNLENLFRLDLTANQLQCYERGLERLVHRPSPCVVYTTGNPGLPNWYDFINYGAGTCILPANEQIEGLETQFSDGIADGWIDAAGAGSLSNQLSQARTALCGGNTAQAIQKLEVFITLVRAKIPRKIERERGEELIAAAQAIIDLLRSGDYEVDCSY